MGRRLAALFASAALITTAGCGAEQRTGEGAAAKTEATVTGKITIKGKPASKGRVTIEPLGANGIPTGSKVAEVGKDGTYTVTTTPGQNDVTVSSTGDAAADSGYNKTSIDAKPGSNTLDLDLPLPR